jgi:DNA modification methylase
VPQGKPKSPAVPVVARETCRLDGPERVRLAELEAVVERGLGTFMEVGQALLEVRDGRLYRESYSSFEEYLAKRWGMSRSRGYQLIDAARVAGAVSTIVDVKAPGNEAQARELVPLLANEQTLVETLRELRACHGERLTAELIQGAVEERLAREAYVREPSPAREPEPPARLPTASPPSKLGGLYQLGAHRLLCGDATSATDVERLMAGERAALLFTSPPYLDLRRFGQGQNLSVEHLADFLPSFSEYADILVVNVGIVRRQHEVVPYWRSYIDAAKQAGLKWLAANVWDKGPGGAHPSGRGGFFPPQHEWLLVFGRTPRALYRTVSNTNAGRVERMSRRQPDGRLKRSLPLAVLPRRPIGSVIQLAQEKGNRCIGHPAPFPVALPKAYIEALTDPGDIVVDAFLGSGSTLVACELTGRRCFGLELEPGFCDLARARFAALVERRAGR